MYSEALISYTQILWALDSAQSRKHKTHNTEEHKQEGEEDSYQFSHIPLAAQQYPLPAQ